MESILENLNKLIMHIVMINQSYVNSTWFASGEAMAIKSDPMCKDILCPRPEDHSPPHSAQVPRKRRASEHDAGLSGLGRGKGKVVK